MSDEASLFPMVFDPSPRLRWMTEHGITLDQPPCMSLFRAYNEQAGIAAFGATEDEALFELADILQIKYWKL